MKKHDINEQVKQKLDPFVISNWKIIPSEDLNNAVKLFNQHEEHIQVEDCTNILWYARGLHDSYFFLKEYSLDSRVPNAFKLPTEYFGVLILYQHSTCILTASWYGQKLIVMDEVKLKLTNQLLTRVEVNFVSSLLKVLV